ncbi:MAG: biliverdin-producing heme oxygenase [Polyangia bacterium]
MQRSADPVPQQQQQPEQQPEQQQQAVSEPDGPAAPGLADRMRQCTAELHAQAEQSGAVREILAGRISAARYALFLRNLLPAYRELERGLLGARAQPGVGALCRPEIFRAPAIESDLIRLAGSDGLERMPLLPEGLDYARRIAAAAAGDGSRLIAHAYVRYLGDLAGGLLLKRRLAAVPGIGPACVAFYEFPELESPRAFARAYRAAIDAAAAQLPSIDGVLAEAADAFRCNIALSEAVARTPGADASPAGTAHNT